jgi:hypothetical protein
MGDGLSNSARQACGRATIANAWGFSMARIRYEALLPQFSVIVERHGVEISRDILSAVDAASARATLLNIRPARLFDPLDKAFVCRVERFMP